MKFLAMSNLAKYAGGLLCACVSCLAPLAFAQPLTFSDVSTAAGVEAALSSTGISWGDYNGDGLEDILVASSTFDQPPQKKPLTLYRNNGNGTFENVSGIAGLTTLSNWHQAVWGDYDNDGDLDVFASGSSVDDDNHLYRNDGDGTFSEVGGVAGVADGMSSRGVAWGDYDNDGHIDLFVANALAGPNRLYHSNGDGTFTDRTQQARLDDAE